MVSLVSTSNKFRALLLEAIEEFLRNPTRSVRSSLHLGQMVRTFSGMKSINISLLNEPSLRGVLDEFILRQQM